MYTYPDKNDMLTMQLIMGVSEGNYWGESEDEILKVALDTVRSYENPKMLDCGCGQGRLLPVFAPYVQSIFALEPDIERYSFAAAGVAAHPEYDITIKNDDASSLTDDQKFDVVLSSHVLPEISAVCDYVIVIAHGKIVAQDTLENLNRSFSGTEMLRIMTKGNGDKLRAALEKIDAADSVTTNAAGVNVTIEVSNGTDIRADVSDILRELDMPVLMFTSNAQSLEDIFIKLINEHHIAEEDTSLPMKKVKKTKEKEIKVSDKGRAYYDDDNDGDDADDDEEYTPLFESDDSDDE